MFFGQGCGALAFQRPDCETGSSVLTPTRLPTSAPSDRRRCAFARVLALALLFVPLGACSSLFDKDTSLADDPADKLYNEGLYLLNQKRDYKNAAKKFEEVDRQHPYSDWARKSLLM